MPSYDQPNNVPPIRVYRPDLPGSTNAEAKLDMLLRRHRERGSGIAGGGRAADDPLNRLRRQFVEDLIPAFQAVVKKYQPQGIVLHLDVERFIKGGNEVLIDIQFESCGVRLLGTVLPNRIAFQKTQYINASTPAETSGPALRTRGLTHKGFREFICEQIADLVRSVVRQARSAPSV